MRNIYIKPCTSFFVIENSTILADSDPEPEVSGDVGAKQSGSVFDDFDSFGSLWDDDPVEDPFAIGD